MIGKTVSHYKILEKLGGGGMGVVYKAEDTKLKRAVALKFLPPELTRDEDAKERFIHEARAASALQHNNICTIHEIDEAPDSRMFICMDCYEGVTLKKKIASGPVAVDEAIDIVIQVAHGLAEAHSRGILHRDIKPANIMVTQNGVVKVVDFGLAKLAGQTKVTKTGTTVGTVSYMSPEQASGEEVDHRSDIFSLGAVMYELLTGHRAFPGDHEAAVIYAILHEDPVPLGQHDPNLPHRLQEIVGKALKKDLSGRYQSMREISNDLEAVKSEIAMGTLRAKPRRQTRVSVLVVAILVAAGYAGYKRFWQSEPHPIAVEEEAFVVGIAPFWGQNAAALEEGKVMQALVERQVIETLGDEDDVEVLGKKYILEPPHSHKEARTLGQALGATVVVWGEVLVLREEVEIQPYVTIAEPLWREKDRSADAMQASLAEPNQLGLRRAKAEEMGKVALLLAGRFYSARDPDRALALLQRISPPTAESHLWQGGVHTRLRNWSEAERMYQKAMELDPDDPTAYRAMAWANSWQRDYDEAITWFERSMALDPNDPDAYCGMGDVYRRQGSFDEAIVWFKKAIQLDPKYVAAFSGMGDVFMRQYKFDEAIDWYKKAIDLEPSFGSPYNWVGGIYFLKREYDEAIEWFTRAIELDPYNREARANMGQVYKEQGKFDQAVAMFEKTIAMDPTNVHAYRDMGEVFFVQEKYDDAVTWFEKAIDLDSTYVYAYPNLGVVYLVQGKYEDAAAKFELANKLDPGDPYNSLLYFICSHRSGAVNEARAHIERRARRLKSDAWLAPIIRFYAGEISDEAVLAAADAEDAQQANTQRCEAYYYIGMMYLIGGHEAIPADTTTAKEFFEKCLSTNVSDFWEYKLAERELEQMANQ